MKVIDIHQAQFEECTKAAQQERVLLTDRGKPVAILVGVAGLDLEQIQLGHDDDFWKLIRQRRAQKTLSRAELDRRLADEETGL